MGRRVMAKLTLFDQLLLSLVILASVAACSGSTPTNATTLDLPLQTTPLPPQSTGLLSPSPVPTLPPSAPAAGTVRLLVREIPADLPVYDRDDWRHWTDADKDCRNTRHEVLIDETLTGPTFKEADQCQVLTGQWLASYTGATVTEAIKLDVDHMVPLANAHRSGAWTWDADQKRDYANHLGDDYHLIAVTASANRSKGAKGPEEWLPPLQSYRCQYATDWVLIKFNWGLSVTASEWSALDEILGTCDQRLGVVLLTAAMPTATSVPVVTAPGLAYDPFGSDRDCGEFTTQAEAQRFYEAAGGPDSDRHRLDRDGNGLACESLP